MHSAAAGQEAATDWIPRILTYGLSKIRFTLAVHKYMSNILVYTFANEIIVRRVQVKPKVLVHEDVTQRIPVEGSIAGSGVEILNGDSLYWCLVDGSCWQLSLAASSGGMICRILVNSQSRVRSVTALKRQKLLLLVLADGSMATWSPSSPDSVQVVFSPSASPSHVTDIQQVAVSCDQSHVAFSSSSSAPSSCISVLSLTSHTCSQLPQPPLADPRAARVCQLAFSHFKQSLLACGYEDGSVVLFDIFARSVVKVFQGAHSAPVSSVQFSPFNRYLMVSVSVDRRYVLFDVEKQKVVRSIVTQHSLSSLAIHANGVVLAVTTLAGQVLLYDLTTGGKQPVVSLDCGTKGTFAGSPLGYIRFFQFDKVHADRLMSFVAADPACGGAQQKRVSKAVSKLVDQSVNYMDVFSPVVAKVRPSAAANVDGGAGKKKLDFAKPVHKKESSPVESRSVTTNCVASSPIVSPIAPSKAVASVPAAAPISTIVADVKPVVAGVDARAAEKVSSVSEVVPQEQVDGETEVTSKDVTPKVTPRKSLAVPFEQSSILNNQLDWSESKFDKLAEHIKDSLIGKLSEMPTQLQSSHQVSDTPGEFSHALMSSVITECMADFRLELKQDIQNMHLELLRQFEMQSSQLHDMLAASTRHIISAVSETVTNNAHPFLLSQAKYHEDESIQESGRVPSRKK